MFKHLRAFSIVMILVMLLPASAAAAKGGGGGGGGGGGSTIVLTPPWTAPSADQLAGSGCTLGTEPTYGSETLICKPSTVYGAPFGAGIVIFAHGYVNPYFPAKKIPWDQMVFPNTDGTTTTAYDLVTQQQYYFATTSYRANGLVVQDAIDDLNRVRTMAINKVRRDNPLAFSITVVLAGVSEGGLITTLSVERFPGNYGGGLAMCGPIGSFQQQINYWGDFRALFDVYDQKFFSSGIPTYGGSAISIPNALITDWYGTAGTGAPRTNLLNTVIQPDKLAVAEDLLQMAKAPYGPQDPSDTTIVNDSIQSTIGGLLDYNIFATMNGQQVLGGNPYGNTGVSYGPTSVIPDLNTLVKRYTANAKVVKNNVPRYETTGLLSKPLVIMHTTGDPIVPYWHVEKYVAKLNKNSPGFTKYQVKTVNRYGHCNFTQTELVDAFNLLGGYLSAANLAAVQQQLSPEEFTAYEQQLREQREQR